jgi:pre-mRNA-processing factor SLU7
MVCRFMYVLTLVYINNHTSVYGSWYRDGKWGYACCAQYHKNSYCTGAAGIEADRAAARLAKGEIGDMPPPPQPRRETPETGKRVLDNEILRDVIKDRSKRKRPEDEKFQSSKRELSVAESALVSEEEYEEYRRNKIARSDDPLLAMQKLEERV